MKREELNRAARPGRSLELSKVMGFPTEVDVIALLVDRLGREVTLDLNESISRLHEEGVYLSEENDERGYTLSLKKLEASDGEDNPS